MLKSVGATAGLVLLLLAGGCATSPPAGGAGAAGAGETALTDEAREELFLDLHSEVLRALDAAADDPDTKILLIEAESMVTIAEEMYLEGHVELAVQLLRESALLLRQTP
jgi:hypothetical protein